MLICGQMACQRSPAAVAKGAVRIVLALGAFAALVRLMP